MKNKQIQSFYEFDSFRLDVKNKRLTAGDDTIALTPKEFDILLFMIENADRVIAKDDLLEAVWKDTFIEEGTLTRNISWLRKKLAAHTASNAKIIETLPKRGYRFLPQIVKNEDILIFEQQTVQQLQIEEIIEIEPLPGESTLKYEEAFDRKSKEVSEDFLKALPPAPPRRRFSPFWFLLPALVLTATLFIAYRGYFSHKQTTVLMASKIVPFSGLPGRENSPAFSPDGKQLVFSWDGGIEGGNSDIYIKLIGSGEPVRLTTDAADEINPVFSPDGKSIAFVRAYPAHNEIIMISALGGAERKIYEKASYASLSFSPDGKYLAAAELDLTTNQTGIFTINLQTGEKTRLTAPEAPDVDHTPRFSPDGKFLAFIRYFSSFRREILVVPSSGGDPLQITSDDVRIYGLAWGSDSRSLFFSSFRIVNQLNLWNIPVTGGEPQLIPTGSKNLQDPAISPDGKSIAFVEDVTDENIWEIAPNIQPRPLIRSSRADHSQQFSPDGTKIVFASERTGNYEIWIADADGKNQRQLTAEQGSAGSPHFSPDGKFIVYDTQIAGGSDLYLISVNGGLPRRLTENAGNNSLPAWSIDGNWIFFLSNRSGENQIWKMTVNGDESVQLTKRGGFEMFAAPDGKKIIYSKGGGENGLWMIGVDGEDEKPFPELTEAGGWRSWFVAANGVYFTTFNTQPPFQIKFFDFKTRQTRKVLDVDKSPLSYYSSLTISPNEKKMLYARQDQSTSTIILASLE